MTINESQEWKLAMLVVKRLAEAETDDSVMETMMRHLQQPLTTLARKRRRRTPLAVAVSGNGLHSGPFRA